MRRHALLLAAAALLAPQAAAMAAPPAPVLQLPGHARTAAVAADPATWVVGARPSRAAGRIARAHDARPVVAGAFVVARDRAGAFARALRRRGLLLFAEPNRLSRPRQAQRAVPDEPLSAQARWRDTVADPALAPPAVTSASPLLALIDSPVQADHPEFAGGGLTSAGTPPYDLHGTATAAVAAAPVNGVGIAGIWPGMHTLNVALPERIRCTDSARGIRDAVSAGAAVINMSYGSSSACFTEYLAVQRATARGVTLVAAAGNEFDAGNAEQFPATLPHVLTVAAATPDGGSAFFSNENAAIDLSAPGVGILTAVPPAFDPDGNGDGYGAVDGTSFAAPMVAAAAAWVRAARPRLRVDQVAQVVRLSARDLGRAGWDQSTGFGMLDVGRALRHSPPPADPLEPNDEIVWVDGRAFGRPHRTIGSRLVGLLDIYEDPIDVYRLRVPARARLTVTARPAFGDPDLALLRAGTRTVTDGRGVLAASERRGRRTERVRIRGGRRSRIVFVALAIGSRRPSLDAGYTLTVRRR